MILQHSENITALHLRILPRPASAQEPLHPVLQPATLVEVALNLPYAQECAEPEAHEQLETLVGLV